jgi:hypothetical protein
MFVSALHLDQCTARHHADRVCAAVQIVRKRSHIERAHKPKPRHMTYYQPPASFLGPYMKIVALIPPPSLCALP